MATRADARSSRSGVPANTRHVQASRRNCGCDVGDVEGDWIVRYIHESMVQPQFLVFTGGGPAVTNSQGMPWSGAYVNANGDLTVDLRSDIAAESRAKIVYEYLLQFTDDPHVQDSLRFLMTREIAHFQMFSAAL